MNDDAVLLRRYAEENSDTAFTELVRRHTNLVYGAALRRTGSPHAAADVAQQVFIALARSARSLSRDTVLAAWLHTATRNAALNVMTSEHRRRLRETRAFALDEVSRDDAPGNWEQLRPLLDAAVDELAEPDRTAVVLRFLEHRAFAEIAAILHVSEDAARMRTERALNKLRLALGRKGVTSTAAALAAVVSSQPVIAAPAGLAASLAAQSLAAVGATATGGGIVAFMTAKIVTTTAISALIAFMIGNYAGRTSSSASSSLAKADKTALEQTVASLRRDNQQLHAQVALLTADVASAKQTASELLAERAARDAAAAAAPTAPAVRRSPSLGLARYEVQQAVLNNLRQLAAAREQYRLENGRGPNSIHALVGRTAYVKTVRTVAGEDYNDLAVEGTGPLTVTTPDGMEITYDPSGERTTKIDIPPAVARAQELGKKVEPAMNNALALYRAANGGKAPPNEKALLPFFATPQEGADFVEFVEARKAARGQ